MILWTIINSVAIVLLTLALFLTIRQVGLLLTHLGPGAARSAAQGPRLGENISVYTEPIVTNVFPEKAPSLFVFATEYCPVCGVVLEASRELAKYWTTTARIVVVFDSLSSDAKAELELTSGNFAVVVHASLRDKLDIQLVPYAVMTDRDGTVIGHGLVNNASHIESLLEINSTNVEPEAANISSGDGLPKLDQSQRESVQS